MKSSLSRKMTLQILFCGALLMGTLMSCSSEKEKRLQWNLKTTLQEYKKVGHRNPQWDTPAKEALKLFAEWRAGQMGDEALAAQIGRDCEKALAAGCNDPLIIYLDARFVVNKSNLSEMQIAAAHRRAADGFKQSDYSSLRKFYSYLRAGETLYKLKPLPKLDVTEMMNDAATALAKAIKKNDAPYSEIYRAARAFMFAFHQMNIPRDRGWEQLEPLLQKKWGAAYAKELALSEPQID